MTYIYSNIHFQSNMKGHNFMYQGFLSRISSCEYQKSLEVEINIIFIHRNDSNTNYVTIRFQLSLVFEVSTQIKCAHADWQHPYADTKVNITIPGVASSLQNQMSSLWTYFSCHHTEMQTTSVLSKLLWSRYDWLLCMERINLHSGLIILHSGLKG